MFKGTHRTFIAYVEDKPGVLNRVTSVFRRRAYNIESLTVGRTHHAGVSRMTIVMEADDDSARRFVANLYKLVNVLYAEDTNSASTVERDLALIKVKTDSTSRPAVMQLCEAFRARVIDIGPEALIAEVPELPGCMADGSTYGEVLSNLETIIDEWTETAQEMGRSIPEAKGRLLLA